MAKQTINIGASPNDGTGTPLRTSFDYCNQNFTELYTATGPSGNNIVVPGAATITGDLTVDTNVLKVNSSTDRVGIATVTPGCRVDIVSENNTSLAPVLRVNSNNVAVNTALAYDGLVASNILNLQSGTSQGIIFNTNAGTERYRIASDGVATWSNVGGVAGTAMTLNSTGLGVGVTPSAWNSNTKVVQIGGIGAVENFNNADFNIGSNFYRNSANALIYLTTKFSTAYVQSATNGNHQWLIAPSGTAGNAITFTQAMTLDASGNFLLNTSTANSSLTQGFNVYFNGGSTQSFIGHITGTSSGAYYTGYSYNGSLIGSITQNGTTGVLFNTSSDYRLKEAVQPLTGGLARINALKPSIYKWKSDGSSGEGFIAHELAEVVPLAVTGEKDAVNEDGSIKPQGVDLSRVVPILVAAIKELSAEVNALKNA